jgi:hypothetical protein
LYTIGTQSQVFFPEQLDEVADDEDNVGDDDREDFSDALIQLLHGGDVLLGLSQPHLDWRQGLRTHGQGQAHLQSRVGKFLLNLHTAF